MNLNTHKHPIKAPRFNRAMLHFELAMSGMNVKSNELRFRKEDLAATVAKKLYFDIYAEYHDYKDGRINGEQFKDACDKAIASARPQLETHRGWKQVIDNVALAVLGLGVFYVIAGLINLAVTGKFAFFSPTNTSEHVDYLEASLDSITPSAAPAA